MACDGDGGCTRSAYYGTAIYGCSYYGLITPFSVAELTFGYEGIITNTFGNQGAIAFAFENQGNIIIGYEEE